MQRTVLGLFAALSVVACSAEVDDLFGGGADGTGGTGGVSTTSVTSTTSTSGPGSTSTSTTGPTTTTSSVSTTGPTTTSVSTGETTSVTTGPEPVLVGCRGGGDCPTETGGVCCWDLQAQSGSCVPSADLCEFTQAQPLVAISCQVPDQCPNQICCAQRAFPSNQSPYDATVCVDPGECLNPDRLVCDPNGAPCPMGMSCIQSSLLPSGYFICAQN